MTVADSGFVITGAETGGRFHSVARFTCSQCPATIDLPLQSLKLNAEGVVKRVANHGWLADPLRANRALCPECQGRKPANDPDSEIRRYREKMATPPSPPVQPSEGAVRRQGAPAVPIREPSADQRATIRKLIEAHFDEDEGCYLDGYSDERIAVEAGNLPAVVAARIREIGYGPIKVSPEEVAIRAALASVKQDMDSANTAVLGVVEKFMAEQDMLKSRIGEIEARIGGLARKSA